MAMVELGCRAKEKRRDAMYAELMNDSGQVASRLLLCSLLPTSLCYGLSKAAAASPVAPPDSALLGGGHVQQTWCPARHPPPLLPLPPHHHHQSYSWTQIGPSCVVSWWHVCVEKCADRAFVVGVSSFVGSQM